MTTKTITMKYDTYECEFGDGFYPVIDDNEQSYGIKKVQITFINNEFIFFINFPFILVE